MALYLETKSNIKTNHKKIYSSDLIEAIFTSPIINPVKLASVLGVHYVTASRHLAQLEKIGVLQSKWVGKYHFFANTSLLQLLHA